MKYVIFLASLPVIILILLVASLLAGLFIWTYFLFHFVAELTKGWKNMDFIELLIIFCAFIGAGILVIWHG